MNKLIIDETNPNNFIQPAILKNDNFWLKNIITEND